MAFALVTTKDSFSAVNGSTHTFTGFGVTIPAGTLIVIGWAGSTGGATISSVTDNSVQAGAANVYTARTPIAMNAATGGTAWCYTTRAILSANTITVNMSPSVTRRSAKMLAFSGANSVPFDVAASQANRTTSPITMGPTAALAQANELAVAFSFWRGGAVASGFANATGSYIASPGTSSGGTTPRMETNAAYKLVSGPAAETNVHTFTSLNAGCGEILTFKIAGAAFSQILTGALTFVGAAPKKTTTRKLPGVLTFSGASICNFKARRISGTFAPTGTISDQLILVRTVTGVFRPTGIVSRSPSRTLSGAFTPTGTQTRIKSASQALAAALTFTGALARKPLKLLKGTLTPSGVVGETLALNRTLSAIFAPTGGVIQKFTGRTFGATLRCVGTVASSSPTILTAVLRPVGSMAQSLPSRTLTAALSFVGFVSKETSRRRTAIFRPAAISLEEIVTPPSPPYPGGGGFGEPKPDGFFKRYSATLRRQR